MQCPTCPEGTVVAFCRNCGKGVCPTCRRDAGGVVHCAECAEQIVEASVQTDEVAGAAAASVPPPPRPAAATRPSRAARMAAPDAPHPLLAGVLGVVPGLGAVYNGQYVKGLVHVVMFGLLLTIASEEFRGLEGFFIPVIALFVLYMPIEAYRTAKALRRGEPVDEMSGLLATLFRPSDASPAAGVALIALGVFLLLISLDVVDLRDLLPGWPVLVVGYGVYRLYCSLRPLPPRAVESKPTEVHGASEEVSL
ncbi:MAG: hypothetical protein GC160_15030 [Acidobacteria bacterium]|nr:hypothetical protein [Acidobacteriota bacterium]